MLRVSRPRHRPLHLLAPAVGLILFAGSLTPVAAAQHKAAARMVTTTFRLHVAGHPDPRTTFWVSYGPLNGTWGLIRLHDTGNGYETATRVLPAAGRTTFAYIAGQGTVHTRLGLAPGNPIITIRVVGPTTPDKVSSTPVQWNPPLG